jgi:hypothetical protein
VNYREIDEVDGELSEVKPGPYKPQTPQDMEKMQKAINVMVEHAVKKGMPRWRAVQWAAKNYTKQMAGR